MTEDELRMGRALCGILRHRPKLVLMDSNGRFWATIQAVISALPDCLGLVTEDHIVAHCGTDNGMAHFALSAPGPNRRISALAKHSYGHTAAPPSTPRATPPRAGPGVRGRTAPGSSPLPAAPASAGALLAGAMQDPTRPAVPPPLTVLPALRPCPPLPVASRLVRHSPRWA